MVRWLGIVGVAVAIAACGGGGSSTTATRSTTTATKPSTVPGPVQVCAGAGAGWRSVTVHAHGARIDAAVLGDGDVGVVFANDSGNSACGWMSFARQLVGRRTRVLVFEYDDQSQAAAEGLAGARALHAAGARRVAMIGASVGGRAVVQAAARDHGTLAAAVSLSAERSVGTNLREILPVARHVRVASLYVGSRDDGYTTFGRDTRQFHRVTPAKVNRMLIVPGGDHGVDLLSDENGPRVRKTILAFLTANTG
jgi:dienelactone hydrolase